MSLYNIITVIFANMENMFLIIAATRKTAKYADLTTQFAFEPIAVETHRVR